MGKLYIGSTKVNMAVKQPNSTNGAGKMFVDVNSFPDGYIKLKYIQPVGVCRINIGNLNTAGTTSLNTEFKFRQISSNTNSKLIAASRPNGGLQVYTNNSRAYNQSAYIDISTGIDYTVYTTTTASRRTITIGSNTQIQDFNRSITDDNPTYMFAELDNSSPTNDRFYYFKIWRNDVLERDLIPALRKSDYKPGLYDIANNVFYTNAGTGEFLYEFAEEPKLPDGYTKLEYIQSTGTQYIDTQYLCNSTTVPNTRYVLEGYASNIAVGNNWWANGMGGNSNLTFYVGLNYNNSALYFVYGDGKADVRTNYTGSYNTRYKWELDMYHSTYKVFDSNGTQLFNITPNKQTPTASQYLTLCRWRYATGGTGYLFSMRIYNVELYTSDILQMKLVPALRNSDSKPGLYDIVNNYFYTNAGTGEFVYAYPEDKELPSEYKKVEYIQSSGSQYIDTGYRFSYGDYFEFTYKQVYNNGAIVSPTLENKGFGAGSSLSLNICGGGRHAADSSNYVRYYMYNADRNFNPTFTYSTMPDHLYTESVSVLNSTNVALKDNDNLNTYFISNVSTPNTTSYNSGNNIHLCKDDSSSYPFWGAKKLYRCTLIKNGVLVLDLRPCIRVSDSKPGLYNLANNTFYYNQGSGEFTYQELPASDVSVKFFNIIKTRPYYDAVYLEDTYGDSYINTGVKLNQDSYVSCEFKVTQYQTNFSMACSPFGARTGWQNNAFNFYIPVNNSRTIYFSYGNQIYSTSSSNILNTTCVVVANKNSWSMVGAVTASKTFTYSAFQNLGDCYMFNTNFYSETPPTGINPSNAHLRISSFSIQDNGTLIRRFVPKVRNDGKPGMYDLCGSICPLTGTPFYINAGSHEFSYQV